MNNYPCTLSLKDIKLWIHLGVGPEERENPQAVSINVLIYFISPAQGCSNDTIEDTISYQTIFDIVSHVAHYKTFKLIEHLAATIYTELYEYIYSFKSTSLSHFTVEVCKVNPPLPNVHGGSHFSYSGPKLSL